MTLGAKLKTRRLELGLSQKDLAEQTNVSLRTIQRIENDRNRPRGYTLRVLSEALDTDLVATVQPVVGAQEPLRRMLLINLLILTFLFIPFGNLIFPTIAWSQYSYYQEVDEVGRRIVNFQITWAVVTFPLLAISPFVDSWLSLPFQLIFVVLFTAYAFNLIVVWLTSRKLRAGDYQVGKGSIRFL